MEDGSTYLDNRIVDALSIPEEYIKEESERQIAEIKRWSLLYRGPDSLLLSDIYPDNNKSKFHYNSGR